MKFRISKCEIAENLPSQIDTSYYRKLTVIFNIRILLCYILMKVDQDMVAEEV